MTNKYIDKLNSIMNYELESNSDFTDPIIRKKAMEFRENISYEKYMELFNGIDLYIKNDKEDDYSKEIVIKLLIKCIKFFNNLDEDIDLFPSTIKIIYKGFIEYNNIVILFSQMDCSDICMIGPYFETAIRYLEFLDNPNYELFIHYCYSEVVELNKNLIDYLDRLEINGVKYRNIINDPVLERMLKEKLNNLNDRKK